MNRVEGILAVSTNNVIGQKDAIPWHHSGDFKHFKSITMGHGVLMGYPTFVGMAKNYATPGKVMLPGRTIFVVGREPFDIDIDIDQSNVIMLPTHGPKDDIETALKHLGDHQKLFIAGGARIYRDYLQYANKVYLTRIYLVCPVDHDTVFLTNFDTKNWRTSFTTSVEICGPNSLKATYFQLEGIQNEI